MNETEVGYVINSGNYLAYIDGLPSIKIHELVKSESGVTGLVNALLPNYVEVFLLNEGAVSPKTLFRRTQEDLSIPVGEFLLGRAINSLAIPIDGKGLLKTSKIEQKMKVYQTPRGMEAREFINQQFITGISLIDSLLPIGKGQRELVIGDGNSGKSRFLTNIVINQKGNNVICIYAAIGKPATAILDFINVLRINKAFPYTVVVASSSTEPTPLILLTPSAAFTIAEYFQSKGHDVLVILDDMSIHAKVYREISLLGNRPPGRESYPGDVFYQQAHLLERGGNFTDKFGGGSITTLPVMEINLNDFTGFIPTNLMSTTDGHLLFRSNLYNKNQRPAVDISLSVSRVGRQTQTVVTNLISHRIRQVLARATQLETLSRFSSELPSETQLILRQKTLIEELLRQEDLTYVPLPLQAILLGLVFTSFLKEKNDAFVRKNKQALINSFTTEQRLAKIPKAVPKLKNDIELIALLEQVSPVLNELFI